MQRKFLLFTLVVSLMPLMVIAEEPSIQGTKKADLVFQDSSGIAIHGYDAVAYLKQGQPVKGKQEFQHNWSGAKWQFASAENRDAFAREPEKFAPQYGGYCAYGMSSGYAAPTDPEAWSVTNGKLYLNYNLEVRGMWSQQQAEHIKKADVNWPKIPKKIIE
jgi:YHS domain-containing protein